MVGSSGFVGLCHVGLAYECVGGWWSLGSFKLLFLCLFTEKEVLQFFFPLLIYSNRERDKSEGGGKLLTGGLTVLGTELGLWTNLVSFKMSWT